MRRVGVGAGDESIEPFHPMGKAVADQKIQRPICHWWLRAQPLGAQDVKHLIGAHSAMFRQQDLKYATAHRGQFQPLLQALRLSGLDPMGDAGAVIVGREASGGHEGAIQL